MSLIRKFRSYFFQNTGTPGTRFRKYDKPTQQTFEQLFDSTGFIAESADTATTVDQGFTKLASDANSNALNSTPDADNFSKVVRPHQLPDVIVNPAKPTTGVIVTKVVSGVGRTGGTGNQYQVENSMVVEPSATVGNPILVTQSAPGETAQIDFDFGLLPAQGQVKVNAIDPSPDYLGVKLTVQNAFRAAWEIIGNTVVRLRIKDKFGEITMYGGTNANFLAEFTLGQGNAGGAWEGWALCDGTTYSNSQAVLVATPDMRASFPVGWYPGGLYPALRSNQDSVLASGENSHVLSVTEIPSHDHSGVTGDDSPDHTHNVPTNTGDHVTAGSGNPAYTNANVTSFVVSDIPNSNHQHSITAQGGGLAHENRPPFVTVGFVMYIG